VVELKRTEHGGHMELQAIRYATMVSAMSFSKAVEVYGRYLERNNSTDDAEFSKYNLTIDGNTLPHLTKRRLVFEVVKAALAKGLPPEQIASMVPPNKWISVDGELTAEEFQDRLPFDANCGFRCESAAGGKANKELISAIGEE
jgi:hypothetical protein